MRRSHQGSPIALPGLPTLTGRREVLSFHFIHWIRLCTPFRPIFFLATTAKHVGKQNGQSAIEPFPPTQSKSLSIEAPLNSGTSCMVRDGKWATTHDSTLFGQEVRPYFPPGSTLVFDTDCFLTFGAKTIRSTCPFFGTY